MLAFIADLHLVPERNSIQREVFDWALGVLRSENPEAVCVLGDMTLGDVAVAKRLRAALDALGIPLLSVTGNSDYRGEGGLRSGEIRDALSAGDAFHGENITAAALELGGDPKNPESVDWPRIDEAFRAAGGRRTVLFSHYPLDYLAGGVREEIEKRLHSGALEFFIAGHTHWNGRRRVGLGECHIVRALDPDKCLGGPPAVTFFELVGGRVRRRDVEFSAADPAAGWSSGEKKSLLDSLGFSCYSDTAWGLKAAAEHGVPVVEIRLDPGGLPPDLPSLVDGWRVSGGRHLSGHLTNIGWNEEDGEVTGEEKCSTALATGMKYGAGGYVLHVPRIRSALMSEGSEAWDKLSDAYVRVLKPLRGGAIPIGIENLHTRKGERSPENRPFGCTPEECLAWVENLRKLLPDGPPVGVHFDAGHARNNSPVSRITPLSAWFARLGTEIVGYHLHQVDRYMTNHHPIKDPFGPMISFSSFFLGWKNGNLPRVPVILEMRNPRDGLLTWKRWLEISGGD